MAIQNGRDDSTVERAHPIAVLFAGLETGHYAFIGVEAREMKSIRVRRSAAETGREWVEGLLDALLHSPTLGSAPSAALRPSLLPLGWSLTPAMVETGSTLMHSHSERVH